MSERTYSASTQESYFIGSTGSGSVHSRTALAPDGSESPPIPEHPYESPENLNFQKEVDMHREKLHRKKNNLLYEAANPGLNHLNLHSYEDGGVRYVHHNDNLYKCFFAVLFLLTLVSIGMCALTLAGFKFGGKTEVQTCVCESNKSGKNYFFFLLCTTWEFATCHG